VNAFRHQPWLRAALLLGVVYILIGRLFPQPADNLRAWRLAAWVASGAAYAAHIAYEHFGLRASPRRTALHTAVGVAIGAFGLALAGMINSALTATAIRPAWLLALVAWPAVTAAPAFLVALVTTAVLARLSRSAGAE
jgi:hypothetical protein